MLTTTGLRRFDVEVSWVGDLTAHQIGEHFATERRLHPNRYCYLIYSRTDNHF